MENPPIVISNKIGKFGKFSPFRSMRHEFKKIVLNFRLMSIIGEYERHCQKYYNNSSAYTSVALLKELLLKLLPANTPPSSPGLVGVFDI